MEKGPLTMTLTFRTVRWGHDLVLQTPPLTAGTFRKTLQRHQGLLQFCLSDLTSWEPTRSGIATNPDNIWGWHAACSCDLNWQSENYLRSEWTSVDGSPPQEVIREAQERWREHLLSVPLIRLTVTHTELTDRIDELRITTDELVLEARAAGATWAEIGSMVGMSRQSAHEKWRGLM
jgi:hypothetical protein